jgi:hypothetical protein
MEVPSMIACLHNRLATAVRNLVSDEDGGTQMTEVLLIIVMIAVLTAIIWKTFLSSSGGAITSYVVSIIKAFQGFWQYPNGTAV